MKSASAFIIQSIGTLLAIGFLMSIVVYGPWVVVLWLAFGSIAWSAWPKPPCDKSVLLGVEDQDSGRVFWISKKPKTWYDELMDWLPQAVTAYILGGITVYLWLIVGR